LIKHFQVSCLVRWRSRIRAEQEPVGVTFDQIGHALRCLGADHDVFGGFVPGNIKVNVVESRIAQDFFHQCRVVLARSDQTPQTHMGPNDSRVLVPLEKCLHLILISRLRPILGKGNVEIVVDQHQQARFCRKIKNAIERRVLEACDFARYFRRDEFFVNREFPDAREHARKGLEHSANVIGGIHIHRVEARDHGIQSCLLFFRQRFIGHRNPGVRKRVVVQRRIGVQIVRRGAIPIHPVGPLLLQGDAEHCRSAGFSSHHVQKLVDVRAFLDIVGQMKM
jgi:hypothetical protein